ncbi:TMV resistance protein N-like [Dorcoceras hygrometricum]|uniref:TMV resistance protein N-like n=1 Tax=Dorcoceras hygrometricum TaxID=472368 RepID=A0A2Z7AFN8_9LAMI|nr:TMV resistance protein N-like [Dorcoceras hygrometricum]
MESAVMTSAVMSSQSAVDNQQMLFALKTSRRKHFKSTSWMTSRKHFKTTSWTTSRKHFKTTSWTTSRKLQWMTSRKHFKTTSWIPRRKKSRCSEALHPVAKIQTQQRIQQKRKAVVDMNQQRSS